MPVRRRGAGAGGAARPVPADAGRPGARARRRTARHHHRRTAAPERGSAAIFVILITVVSLGLAGLIVDGGLAIAQRERAMDVAEQAARRVSDDVDTDALRDGRVVIRGGGCTARAQQATAAFRAGRITDCRISGGAVEVSVAIGYRPALLGFFTDHAFTARGSATARPETGINASGGN